MSVLLHEALTKSSPERSVSLLSDIWMNISKYASIESLLPVYEVIIFIQWIKIPTVIFKEKLAITRKKKIALFFLEVDDKPELQKRFFVTAEINDSNDLFEIYWRAIIFKYSKLQNTEIIIPLLERIFAIFASPDNFTKDMVGTLLKIYRKEDDASGNNLLKTILDNYENYKESLNFLRGWNKLVSNLHPSESLKGLMSHYPSLLLSLTDNFMLPDGKIRYETLELMKTLMILQGYAST
ncbi:BEM_collapsed_G0001980.mRNA.1.CDS.1 [Saccharomyces cerevisiae]|nr:BEM_collapsed_G0001980.mRNA.1.CDS.1 [Saccharomyces cerevisiae]